MYRVPIGPYFLEKSLILIMSFQVLTNSFILLVKNILEKLFYLSKADW